MDGSGRRATAGGRGCGGSENLETAWVSGSCAPNVPTLLGHFCLSWRRGDTPKPTRCRRQKSAGMPGKAKASLRINSSSQAPAHFLISHWPLCRRSIRKKKKKKKEEAKWGIKRMTYFATREKKKKKALSRFCSNCRCALHNQIGSPRLCPGRPGTRPEAARCRVPFPLGARHHRRPGERTGSLPGPGTVRGGCPQPAERSWAEP